MTRASNHSGSATSSTELALRVLFGDAFTANLEPSFVESLTVHQDEWAVLLRSIWTIAGGTPTVLNALAVAPVEPTSRALPAAPPQAPPPPAPEAPAVEVFNPSGSEDNGRPTREQAWQYEEVRDELKALFEESTGYPEEVLEEDADLEADLAIDSVKQVEALGKLRERYELQLEDNFAIRDYRTIRKAATYLVDRLNRDRLIPAAAR
jgi:acyl carrier protein